MTLANDITARGLWSETDADIAETMSAVTHGPIDVLAVRYWLRSNGLLLHSVVTGGLTGTLAPLVTNGPFSAGMTAFVEHIFDPGSRLIATNEPTWAVQAAQLLGGLVAAQQITVEQRAAFYQLDGGLMYADGVTEAQVVTARAERDAQVAAAARLNEIRTLAAPVAQTFVGALVINAVADEAAFVAALRTLADAIEGD